MPVSVTFTGESWKDVAAQMSAALSGHNVQIVVGGDAGGVSFSGGGGAGESAGRAQTGSRGKKDSSQPDTSSKPNGGSDTGSTGGAGSGQTNEIDYDTVVKPAMLKLAEKGGRELVMATLGPFNVTNANKVAPEKRGELMDAINAALEAE